VVLTVLVLQIDSLLLAVVPWVMRSAAALPAGIHMAMKQVNKRLKDINPLKQNNL